MYAVDLPPPAHMGKYHGFENAAFYPTSDGGIVDPKQTGHFRDL
jgi:hypothetical protein